MQLLPPPYTEDPTIIKQVLVAAELNTIHNALIRSINSIYIQAPRVPTSEHNNFTAYCLATYKDLLAVETIMFKALEQRTGATELARIYDARVTAWGNWIQSISQQKNNFSSDMCVSMMNDFMPALQALLDVKSMDVIGVWPRYMHLDITEMWDAEKQRVFGEMSKTKVLPVFWLNHDEAFGEEFPKIEGLGMWIAREVCARRNKRWWKFSTVGFGGGRREVRYVGYERRC
jgi:hypothetical protein